MLYLSLTDSELYVTLFKQILELYMQMFILRSLSKCQGQYLAYRSRYNSYNKLQGSGFKKLWGNNLYLCQLLKSLGIYLYTIYIADLKHKLVLI